MLSGGEQQMLTLCRTLMGDPDLIMIDEPTEGLAPKIVELVAEYLRELKRRGISVLLVEQKLTIALEVSQRCLVMGHGQIVFEGTPDRPARQRRHAQGVARGVASRQRLRADAGCRCRYSALRDAELLESHDRSLSPPEETSP